MIDPTRLFQKTVIVYAKTGPAVYHSHHDMIRFWERAVKRAGLPMRRTQGYNPRPRLIFPHALGLGIISRREEIELEFFLTAATAEVLARLRQAVGGTLEIVNAFNLPAARKSRQLRASDYLISGWPEAARAGLAGAAGQILAMKSIPVERGAPDNRRSLDIRQYLRHLRVGQNGDSLDLGLKHTPTGSARPDEISKLAARLTGADHHDLLIEKTAMRLE